MAPLLRFAVCALLLAAAPADATRVRFEGLIESSGVPALVGQPFTVEARYDPSAGIVVQGDSRRFRISHPGGRLAIEIGDLSRTTGLGYTATSAGLTLSFMTIRPLPGVPSGVLIVEGVGGTPLPPDRFTLPSLLDPLAQGCCEGTLQVFSGIGGTMGTSGRVQRITVLPEAGVSVGPGAVLAVALARRRVRLRAGARLLLP